MRINNPDIIIDIETLCQDLGEGDVLFSNETDGYAVANCAVKEIAYLSWGQVPR